MLIAGFALWAVEPPEAGVALHQARAAGNEGYEDALESRLKSRQWSRKVLLGSLFAGSLLMTFLAFLVMQETQHRTTSQE